MEFHKTVHKVYYSPAVPCPGVLMFQQVLDGIRGTIGGMSALVFLGFARPCH